MTAAALTPTADLDPTTISPPAGWQTAEEMRRRFNATCSAVKFRAALRVLVDSGAMETRIAGRVREYRAKR